MSFPVYPAPVYQQPKPMPLAASQTKPPKPPPAKPQAAVVPPPAALGIRVDDVPFVEVPEPAKLGIKLE